MSDPTKKPTDAAGAEVALAPLDAVAARVQDEGFLPEAWTLRLLPAAAGELSLAAGLVALAGIGLELAGRSGGTGLPVEAVFLLIGAAAWGVVVTGTVAAVARLGGTRPPRLAERLHAIAGVAGRNLPLAGIQTAIGMAVVPVLVVLAQLCFGSAFTWVGGTLGVAMLHAGAVRVLVRRALVPEESGGWSWWEAHRSLLDVPDLRLATALAMDVASLVAWGVLSIGLVFHSRGMTPAEHLLWVLLYTTPILAGGTLATTLMAHAYAGELGRERLRRLPEDAP